MKASIRRTARRALVVVLALVPAGLAAVPGAATAGEPPPRRKPRESAAPCNVPMTLADAVFIALRDNRSAHIARIAQKFALRVAEDRFAPQFAVSGAVVRQRIGEVRATDAEITPSATVQVPPGATFGFAWVNTMTSAGGVRTRASAAELSVTQPLLRGGGVEATMVPVRSARLTERINQLRLKATVSETVTQVIFGYRDLLCAQEELKLANDAAARADPRHGVAEPAGRRADQRRHVDLHGQQPLHQHRVHSFLLRERQPRLQVRHVLHHQRRLHEGRRLVRQHLRQLHGHADVLQLDHARLHDHLHPELMRTAPEGVVRITLSPFACGKGLPGSTKGA
ncbi:MAG TPA: TolC family protein [Azospirillum sp.]